MLEADDQQASCCLFSFCLVLEPFFPELSVFIEQAGQFEFRSIIWETVNGDLNYISFGEAALNFADVFFQPADDDFVPVFCGYRHATTEPLRIKNFQQSREAVGMAVVGSRRQE